MRHLSTAELLAEDVDIHSVCAFSVREGLGRETRFSGDKRHCSVLFLYLAGEREYTTANGETFLLQPGNIMYVPQYATYRFCITKAESDGLDRAIAIDFEMRDIQGEVVCLGDAPRVIVPNGLSRYGLRFEKIRAMDSGLNRRLLLKSAVFSLCYDLFCERHQDEAKAAPWRMILPAIEQIEAAPAQDVPIPQMARQCGVSETLFRQLFLQYTGGESAVRYRNRLRLELTERLMRTEQMTVERAAREAGFRDMSHFYRLYRRYTQEK